MFFKTGEADILIPASRSTERDKTATFVPLIQVSPALISLKSRQLAIASVKQLTENRALRGALVRTFTYGDEYQALLLELDKDKRIDSGAYVSRASLEQGDQDTLRKLLTDSVKGDVLWNAFVKYYPPEVLRGVVTRKAPRDN
jgi:polar amino acid transport system substrate-binding protein